MLDLYLLGAPLLESFARRQERLLRASGQGGHNGSKGEAASEMVTSLVGGSPTYPLTNGKSLVVNEADGETMVRHPSLHLLGVFGAGGDFDSDISFASDHINTAMVTEEAVQQVIGQRHHLLDIIGQVGLPLSYLCVFAVDFLPFIITHSLLSPLYHY